MVCVSKFPLMLEALEESSRCLADRRKIHSYGELTHGVRCPRVSCDAPFIHPGIQCNMAECARGKLTVLNCH